jgi:hypothetical protein
MKLLLRVASIGLGAIGIVGLLWPLPYAQVFTVPHGDADGILLLYAFLFPWALIMLASSGFLWYLSRKEER